MSDKVPFINLDCQWLDELGVTFIDDGDLATGARLRQIAQRFQALDERLLTLSSQGEYVAGRQSVFQELAQKSNLPPEFHPKAKRPQVVDETKVRKMPAHKTTSQLQAEEIAKQINAKRAAASKEKFAGLAGLKLNLSVLKK